MHGLMQQWSLTIDKILEHAMINHGAQSIVTREADGAVTRSSYAALYSEARRFSGALQRAGIGLGDRVATLAWNNTPHLATWYGTMGIGAVLHTLNPRIHPEQLAWIINHAEDRLLVVEAMFFDLVAKIAPRLHSVEQVIVFGDAPTDFLGSIRITPYSDFIADTELATEWGNFDEETAAGLCYTSGTTGNPKGVLYSHRSNLLHALAMNQPDVLGLKARDVVLPVVPMFHANAWALTFVAPMSGAKLVLPGPRLDGASLLELLENEKVSVTAAVPTVWQGLLEHLDHTGERLTSLRRCIIGGAAVSESMMRAFEDRYGVEVVHAWGMTELSPVGTIVSDRAHFDEMTAEQLRSLRLKQGATPFSVEMKIVDDDGCALPRDGKKAGNLLVRGPAVVSRYFGSEESVVSCDGFFDTGDVATIDEHGFMHITDRAKDIIKSGGEWISSVEIENLMLGHPDVARAAVIAIPDHRWGERPLLIVQLRDGAELTAASLVAYLVDKVARWWLPNAVATVDQIPLGATGKINKLELRLMLPVLNIEMVDHKDFVS